MKLRNILFAFFSAGTIVLLIACGGSSDGNNLATGSSSSTASLGTSIKNVDLDVGVPVEVKFTFTVPGEISAKGDISINMAKTLQYVSLSATQIAKNTSRF